MNYSFSSLLIGWHTCSIILFKTGKVVLYHQYTLKNKGIWKGAYQKQTNLETDLLLKIYEDNYAHKNLFADFDEIHFQTDSTPSMAL